MRKLIVGFVAAAALAVAGSAAAHGPPPHLHCITTPSGNTHAIAPGVTFHAAHEAFFQFHTNVHRGVFGVTGAGPFNVEGKHPFGEIPLTFAPTCD